MEQNRDTHSEARSRIREITNLITSKFQSFMNKPTADSAKCNNNPVAEDNVEEEVTDDAPGFFEDDVRDFPATDAKNMDVLLEDAPACDAKDTNRADDPITVLSDAEESTSTSNDDAESSTDSENDYEAFLYPDDVLDDQLSVDPSTTLSKDKVSRGMLRFGPVPVAAELSDNPELQVPIADLGEVEAETINTGGDAGAGVEGIDAGDESEGDAVVAAQEEAEDEEGGAAPDTDSTGDSDVPFETIASDYEDLTESSSDSDDNDDDDDDPREDDGYVSDAFNGYDDYSDYDATDMDSDDDSDDLLYLNEGELSDLADTSDSDSDEYDTDSSTSSDDEAIVAADEIVPAEAEAEPEAVDVDEAPQAEEGTPEAAS